MTLPLAVTVTDIAGNIADKPTLMAFDIDGQLYPEPEKTNSLLAKVFNYTAFEHGLVKIDDINLTFSDETGRAFKTLTTAELTQIELGMYHSMVQTYGPVVPLKAQYTGALTLTTAEATYRLLVFDTRAMPAIIAWLHAQKLTFTDPLNLAAETADFDWSKITEKQFGRWAKDTKYEEFYQTIGPKRMV